MVPGNQEHSRSRTMTVEKQNNSIAFFDEKITKNVSTKSRGCPDDIQRMVRGWSEDVQRISRGYPEDVPKGIQRGPKDLQRKDWGCIVMHTSA